MTRDEYYTATEIYDSLKEHGNPEDVIRLLFVVNENLKSLKTYLTNRGIPNNEWFSLDELLETHKNLSRK